MSHWDYANAVPTAPWRGQLSIPRELRLARTQAGLRLAQRPIAELARLRRPLLRVASADLAVVNRDLAATQGGSALEIDVVLAPRRASTCAIAVRSAGAERTVVGFDAARSEVFLDRTCSGATKFSPAFPGIHRATVAPVRGSLALRIFVDTCSVEVFAEGGRTVLSDLVFPDTTSTGIELLSDADTSVRSLEIFRLDA
jgi:sucrose-6-phosphate hydrolase SacC (GH32 family)